MYWPKKIEVIDLFIMFIQNIILSLEVIGYSFTVDYPCIIDQCLPRKYSRAISLIDHYKKTKNIEKYDYLG